MTAAAGAGHVEKIGGTWFLRRRSSVRDEATGITRRLQTRIRLGTTRELRSEAAARQVADAYLARLAPAKLAPGLATTFAAYAEMFLRDQVGLLRESSRRRYQACIRRLQRSLAGVALADVDTRRLQQAITEAGQQLAPATTRTLRAVALQIIRRARVDKFGAHAIAARDIALPKQSAPAKVRQSWTAEQLEQLIAASSQPWATLWAILGYGGLRAGEALALRWDDVDLDRREIHVRGNRTRTGIAAPKTATSAATIPILPRLVNLLAAYRASLPSDAQGLLFTTRTGSPLSADDVRSRQLHPLLARLGLPRAGLHSFRHSTPAILAGLGLTFDAVRICMRHSDIRMTQRYLHSDADDVRRQLDQAIARKVDAQPSAAGTAL